MNPNGRHAQRLLAGVWILMNSHAMAQIVTKEYFYKKQTINKKRPHVFAGTNTLLLTAYVTPATQLASTPDVP